MKTVMMAAFAVTIIATPVLSATPDKTADPGPSANASCQAQFNDYFGGNEAGDINGLGNKSKYWQQEAGQDYVTAEYEALQRKFFRGLICGAGR
jgi:hypothetical protein